MARLGRRLSSAGRVSIVYTYSPAAAGAMKLLSTLILGGKIDVVGAAPTSDITTALDDAETAAGSQDADSVLYIGGPPRSSEVFGKSIKFLKESGKALVLNQIRY